MSNRSIADLIYKVFVESWALRDSQQKLYSQILPDPLL